MQHILAPGGSPRVMPRFVAPSAHGREARLGLHRMAPGLIARPVQAPRSPAGRISLRDVRGMTVARPRAVVSGIPRREQVLHWTRGGPSRRGMAALRALPWRR